MTEKSKETTRPGDKPFINLIHATKPIEIYHIKERDGVTTLYIRDVSTA